MVGMDPTRLPPTMSEDQGRPSPDTMVPLMAVEQPSGQSQHSGRRKMRFKLLPVVTFIFITSSLTLTYIVAEIYGHIDVDFPYISYTGIHNPERGLFSQLVNIGALLVAANIYVRYKQMSVVLTLIHSLSRDRVINRASLWVGWLSTVGLSIVANFQISEMRGVHYTGAGLAFTLGLVYCWLQTSLSLRYCRWTMVTVAQLINSFVLSVCTTIFATSKIIYHVRKGRGEGTKWDTLRSVYLVSTVSEWLTTASIIIFMLTFYRDFSRIDALGVEISLDTEAAEKDFRRGFPAIQSGHCNSTQNGCINPTQNGQSVSPV